MNPFPNMFNNNNSDNVDPHPQMMQQQMAMHQQEQQMMMQEQINMQQEQPSDLQYYDVYNYIKEDKKKIRFKNVLNDQYHYVKIPCSLRKNELYYTAEKFKKYDYSQIQLYHNNNFLDSNEDLIDCIKDNDEIKIIEQLHGVDFGLFERYYKNHKNEKLMNIRFDLSNGKKMYVQISNESSIEEMFNLFFSKSNIPLIYANNYTFTYGGNTLKINDKNKLKNKTNNLSFYDSSQILVFKKKDLEDGIHPNGKILDVRFNVNNETILNTKIGTLNMIKNLIYLLKFYDPEIKSIKSFKISGINYEQNDDKTLSSYGIRENFVCEIYTDN